MNFFVFALIYVGSCEANFLIGQCIRFIQWRLFNTREKRIFGVKQMCYGVKSSFVHASFVQQTSKWNKS